MRGNLWRVEKVASLLCAIGVLLWSPSWARRAHGPVPETSKPVAQSTLQAGLDALAARDLASAEQKICAAYLEAPSPDGLYALAQLALAEGKQLQAQDLMRRFLADPLLEATPDSPQYREAERILALPMLPSALLDIQGSRGTIIKLDARPVGVLPLPEPIRTTVGEHHIEILAGERAIRDTIQLRNGRIYELRYNLSTRALIRNVLPGVVVQFAPLELSPADTQRMRETVDGALQKERYSALRAPSDAKSACTEEERCAVHQARQLQAEYVLLAHARQQGTDWRLSMSLTDVAIGVTAAKAETNCAGCAVDVAAARLAALTAPLLKQASTRPQGRVHLLSDPSGATVTLDGQPIGITPYQGPMFVGRQKLIFVRSRFAPETVEITVLENQITEHQVKLTDLVDEPPPASPVYPTPAVCPAPPAVPQAPSARLSPIRLAMGLVSLSAGALMIGLGAPAIAIDGFCADAELSPGSLCMTRFHSLPTGAALVGIGSAATIGAAILLTLPAPRK